MRPALSFSTLAFMAASCSLQGVPSGAMETKRTSTCAAARDGAGADREARQRARSIPPAGDLLEVFIRLLLELPGEGLLVAVLGLGVGEGSRRGGEHVIELLVEGLL